MSFFAVILLFFMMVNPAYALVTSVSLEKESYSNTEKIVFVGTESDGKESVYVIIYGPFGKNVGMLADPASDADGSFETIPRSVDEFFTTKGTYTATAFTQQLANGTNLLLDYDGTRVTLQPNIVLSLAKIGDKSVVEKQTLSFTAKATDSSITDLEFKLDKNPPDGATIDSKTGLFSWTPTELQGPASYVFDVVVLKGAAEDRETITVTVTETTVVPPPPAPVKSIPDFVDPKLGAQHYLDRYNNDPNYKDWFDTYYPDYTIQEAIELAIPDAFSEPEPSSNVPNFVDPKLGAQYYLDRYNNEPAYKDWFDTNYPDYTIQEAIELAIPDAFPEPEPPTELAPFVDPNQDPQYYIDRYNNEETYKEWFDENFPDMTIYEAVGVQPPQIGICGSGTQLVNGECVLIRQGGGGCLIATAAYGSEMAHQVQFLREIRDNTVLPTESGNSFMNTFNSIYYSFSPTIADLERQSPIFKNIVQTTITPLLTTLSILSVVDINSEEEMLGYGIGVILLNLGIYFAAPTLAIIKIRKYLNN